MKIVVFVFTLFFVGNVIAQQKNCIVNVKINGKMPIKNMYLYIYDRNDLIKQTISIDSNTFDTGYQFNIENGNIQYARIVLSDSDILSASSIPKINQGKSQKFILEPIVNVQYNLFENLFIIKGDSLNKVESLFYKNEVFYQKRRDSAFIQVDKSDADDLAKQKRKAEIRRLNYKEQTTQDLYLIKKNINSVVSLDNFFTFVLVPIKPINEIRAVFQLFPKHLSNSARGKLADSLLTVQENMLQSGLKIGEKMPLFKLNNSKNESVTSADVFGKYSLIDFWASWCAPCRAENPNLKLAYQAYHKKGFNIISISIDTEKDKEKWLAAIKKDETQDFINLFNPSGTSGIAKDLGINAIPANYLVDKNGIIVGINLRGNDLEKKLSELLSK